MALKETNSFKPLRDLIYRQILFGVRYRNNEDKKVYLFRELRKYLSHILGDPITFTIFYNFGKFEGEITAKKLSLTRLNFENLIQMALVYLELEGLATLNSINISKEKDFGNFLVHNLIDNNLSELNGEKCYFGEGGGVGCYFTRGFLEKLLNSLLNREILIKELRCEFKGHEYCEYSYSIK